MNRWETRSGQFTLGMLVGVTIGTTIAVGITSGSTVLFVIGVVAWLAGLGHLGSMWD